MTFQILALPSERFAPLFSLSDADLKARNIVRQTVTESPGTPCRVSLADAAVGETVLLLNYEHQPEASPYRASHAIFVRQGAEAATPAPGEVPEVLTSRLLSLRAFDKNHMMVAADVVDGKEISAALDQAFKDDAVAYIHLHNARPGCFAAAVIRAA